MNIPNSTRKWITCLALISQAFLSNLVAQEILPKPQPAFQGKIGRTVKDSTPDFPKGVEAPKGAPNILVILTDDVGFGASSTFGGPIPTPTMDRLAKRGSPLHGIPYHGAVLPHPGGVANGT